MTNLDYSNYQWNNMYNTSYYNYNNWGNYNNFDWSSYIYTSPSSSSTKKETEIESGKNTLGKTTVLSNTNPSNNTSTSVPITQEQLDAAESSGKKVYSIVSSTNGDSYKTVDTAIKATNKDTIIKFLDGFYSERPYEGIIEYLDDEWDDGAITMQGKLNLIKSLIECAVERGATQDQTLGPIVQQLSQFYEMYTTGKFKDAKDFDNNGEISWDSVGAGAGACAVTGAALGFWVFGAGALAGGAIGAAVGAIGGLFDRKTDDERIDELIKQLHTALKTPQTETKIDKTA